MNMTPPLHRIGAVAALSGVPVSTLRVWESRYGAFEPDKTEGRHRLYGEDDVLRASLLKQLTQAGHAISTIATLDAHRLGQLLQRQRQGVLAPAEPVAVAVVGLPLAQRLQSEKFSRLPLTRPLHVVQTWPELPVAHTASDPPAQLLLVRVGSLQGDTREQLRRLRQHLQWVPTIVLFSFGTEHAVNALQHEGVMVRREPLLDQELGQLIGSVMLVDPHHSLAPSHSAGTIPRRKYSEATLARVAAIPSQVMCECPRHVAELITQLAEFEQYSLECLHKSAQDAHIHAHLSAVSGSARALFEQALEMLAQHEGIALTP